MISPTSGMPPAVLGDAALLKRVGTLFFINANFKSANKTAFVSEPFSNNQILNRKNQSKIQNLKSKTD
jgi:hypothetical protein